ncbi:methyltransferase [Leucobacter sp. USCH14]|uniref:class I SAM-dependent methyltransferase n=1 Tax=Leucobacter sp. USCH14 TaxID=3024838 RepID=UPI003099FCD3
MHAELVDRLRADLRSSDYSVDSVTALLGPTADSARQRGVFAPARRALANGEPGPLATLVRCFLLGERLAAGEIHAALPALTLEGARELGILQPAAHDGSGAETGFFVAAVSVNPVRISADEHWWVVSDLDDQLRRGPARANHVMGVGGATRSLLAQAPGASVGAALDLGTGCGIVAMHLTRFASRVIATDISERALEIARANARLNGVDDRIEFRAGDLFEPVRSERFDLILSNPPFVITPRSAEAPVYEYRDGGRTGDALAQSVIETGPALLRHGGTLLCLANWESPWGANGLTRVADWIGAAEKTAGPLQAWVIERDRVEPASYAETWVRDGGARPGDAEFERLLAEWIDDFSQRRITAVGLGSVRVQRAPASAGHIVHLDVAAGAYSDAEGLGDALQRAFEIGAATAQLSEAEVLAARWVLDDSVTETREHRPGQEAPRRIALETAGPIARRIAADTLLAAALGACDGELSLAQIADALASLLEVDAAASREALVAGVRELVWFGMLEPAS